MVFDDLILYDAHAGLGYGHLGQGNPGLIGGHGGGKEDFVHLLLGIIGENSLGFPYLSDLGGEVLSGFHQFGCNGFGFYVFFHDSVHPSHKILWTRGRRVRRPLVALG